MNGKNVTNTTMFHGSNGPGEITLGRANEMPGFRGLVWVKQMPDPAFPNTKQTLLPYTNWKEQKRPIENKKLFQCFIAVRVFSKVLELC